MGHISIYHWEKYTHRPDWENWPHPVSGLSNGDGMLVDKNSWFFPLTLSLMSINFLEDTSASVWLDEFGCHCYIQSTSQPEKTEHCNHVSERHWHAILSAVQCLRMTTYQCYKSTCCLHLIFSFQLPFSYLGRFDDLVFMFWPIANNTTNTKNE